MMQPLRDLRVALGFLTRIPVGDVGGGKPVELARAVPWFPLVGLLVGLAHGGAWRGLAEVTTPFVAAACATALALLITGAFHHDGLADIADAFGGGWTVEQRFEILKDSRLGTYGTAALASAIVIEVGAVASLEPRDGFLALVGAHGVGRAMAVLTMVVAPIAGDGLGASYVTDLSWPWAVMGSAVALAVAAVVSPVLFVWPLVGAAVAAALVIALSIRKIGGVTGDVLGAITVLAALAALVVTTAV
ncbi:MAG: adenosylcobinamide-GDP ribazoletransferase [Actinomycetota bacterium]